MGGSIEVSLSDLRVAGMNERGELVRFLVWVMENGEIFEIIFCSGILVEGVCLGVGEMGLLSLVLYKLGLKGLVMDGMIILIRCGVVFF